jgi:hypothetical protein
MEATGGMAVISNLFRTVRFLTYKCFVMLCIIVDVAMISILLFNFPRIWGTSDTDGGRNAVSSKIRDEG